MPGPEVVWVIIEARKGLAAPPPVICGRRPTPKVGFATPVGWAFRVDVPNPDAEVKPPGEEKPPVGWDEVGDGIETGGRESRRAAPKDDVGLKAFNPTKPVV
jgi:hypothetical protein